MFNNVLRCFVSHATISIADRMAADRLRDCDNAAGIGNDSGESHLMINSVQNKDWSNSVPGRQIPKGALDVTSTVKDHTF